MLKLGINDDSMSRLTHNTHIYFIPSIFHKNGNRGRTRVLFVRGSEVDFWFDVKSFYFGSMCEIQQYECVQVYVDYVRNFSAGRGTHQKNVGNSLP